MAKPLVPDELWEVVEPPRQGREAIAARRSEAKVHSRDPFWLWRRQNEQTTSIQMSRRCLKGKRSLADDRECRTPPCPDGGGEPLCGGLHQRCRHDQRGEPGELPGVRHVAP